RCSTRGSSDLTPYSGMPALRRKSTSVAPVLTSGITVMPGHMSSATCSTGSTTEGSSGEAGLASAGAICVTETPFFAAIAVSTLCVSSAEDCGSTRQLTVALAVCGNAFSACPPSSWVAKQVVRASALKEGCLTSVYDTWGSAETSRMHLVTCRDTL